MRGCLWMTGIATWFYIASLITARSSRMTRMCWLTRLLNQRLPLDALRESSAGFSALFRSGAIAMASLGIVWFVYGTSYYLLH